MLAWFTVILVCQLIGESIVTALHLPFPGPVLGMVALFGVLVAKRGVPGDLARVGDTLLANLSLLFVPAGVGVMAHFVLLKNDWAPLGAAIIGSTVITVAVTALAMAWLSRMTSGGKGDGEASGGGEGA
ncbi:MAG: CidA/LrgA family protein [Salaquimonas sp.]|jgi:holin-like protein|nr:CidA/LrgA family protein [Salaquimonas sp.]